MACTVHGVMHVTESCPTRRVLDDIRAERARQVERYGNNEDLVDGTGPETRWLLPFTAQPAEVIQMELRRDYDEFEDEVGKPTWVHLVREEVAEAFQETEPVKLRAELVQVAALAVSWIEKLDAR